MKFRKLGRAEWESFWPLLPPEADSWPALEGDEGSPARNASILARRRAEFAWLRALPDDEQVRYQGRRNDIAFRTIAACCLQPTFTVAQARALGDDADVLYLAIMTRSGLYKEPPVPTAPPPTAEEPSSVVAAAPADAA